MISENTGALKKAEEICKRMIVERGWLPFNDLKMQSFNRREGDPFFRAHITMENRVINLHISDGIEENLEKMIKAHDLKTGSGVLFDTLIRFGLVHEYGHHIFCPRRDDYFKEILESIADSIRTKEISSEKILSKCFLLHNLFSDTILNTINAQADKEKKEYRLGLNTFYQSVGFNNPLKKTGIFNIKKQKLDKAMSLFIRTNQLLCSVDPQETQKIERYYPSFFPEFNRHSRKIIDIFTDDISLTKAIYNQDPSNQAWDELIDRLKDHAYWPKMAFEYACLINRYIQEEQRAIESSYTRRLKEGEDLRDFSEKEPQEENYEGNTGKGSSKKDDSKKSHNPSDKKNEENKEGNLKYDPNIPAEIKQDENAKNQKPTEKSMLENIVKKLVEGKIQDHHISSEFLKHYKKLDNLYRNLAGKLIVRADSASNQSTYEKMFGEEEMLDAEIQTKNINWAGTRILRRDDGSSDIRLSKRDIPLTLELKNQESPGGIFDLSFIFDSSASMAFQPFNKIPSGQYHYAALAFYSILKNLQDEGLAPLINFNVINYANFTRESGWRPYREIEIVKRAMFDYQGGYTILDPLSIKRLRTTRLDNFISFMLTDSGFNNKENEQAIVDEIGEISKLGNIGFYLFQIGGQTNFSCELEKMNIPVQYITSAEDFMNTTIRFTKDLYGRVAND
jgi:hypothetical protein